MKDRDYLKKIVIFPTLSVFFTSLLVSSFHIYFDSREFDTNIKEYRQKYYSEQKEILKEEVEALVSKIKYEKQQIEEKLQKRLKRRTDRAYNLVNIFYLKNRDKLSKKEMQERIILILSNAKYRGDNYYFIFQESQKKNHKVEVISPHYRDENIKAIKNALHSTAKHSENFIKYNCFKTEKDSKKIAYLRVFKPFNWIIGYSECYNEIEEELKKEFVDEISKSRVVGDRYPVIVELLDIDGGSKFAKVLLNKSRPELVGKCISENVKDRDFKSHRREMLRGIKKDGFTYVNYISKKPNSEVFASKTAYFQLEKDWNWIIQYGIYFDDIEKEVVEQTSKIKEYFKYNIIISLLITICLSFFVGVVTYFIFRKIVSQIIIYEQKEQNEIFETLYQKSTDSILIIEDGKFVDCNEAAVKVLLAKGKEEVISCNPSEISPQKQNDGRDSYEKAQEMMNLCLKNGACSFEWQHKTFEGKIFTADIILTYIKLRDRGIIHARLRDITEKLNLQEENAQKQRMIEHQSKLAQMGEMLQNIAHQWKQPLAQINAVLISVDNEYKQGKLTQIQLSKKLDQIEELTAYMSNTIFSFSHYFDSKKENSSVSVQKVIERAVSLLQPLINREKIEINITYDTEHSFIGDEKEFIQVILVIISNAMDILKIKKVLHPLIKIDVKSQKDQIVIEIWDNGGGVPLKSLEKIFEPFFSTKEYKDGSGIGLYMAKMIVENTMHGELSVQNIDNGALFTIKLYKDLKI
ncbi:MAG: cache domain-containing protein [Campylobacterota bacterium]|nr:cache domain-containing protein [Campylobacterota bacterium]